MAKKIVEYDNLCVGCETCRHCGRDKDYPVYALVCDDCGDDDVEELYEYNGQELCKGCLLYNWLTNHSLSQIFSMLTDKEFEQEFCEDYEKVKLED